MTQIPPPTVYRGISTGRKHTHVYEPQSGIPIDGSDSSLREYSPFRLRLIVPSVLDRMIKFDKMERPAGQVENPGKLKEELSSIPVVTPTPPSGSAEFNLKDWLWRRKIPDNSEDYPSEEYISNLKTVSAEVEKARLYLESYYGSPVTGGVISGGGFRVMWQEEECYRELKIDPATGKPVVDSTGKPTGETFINEAKVKRGSKHLKGEASDLRFFDSAGNAIPEESVVSLFNLLMDSGKIKQGGLSMYSDGYIHYDIRGERIRDWTGRGMGEDPEIFLNLIKQSGTTPAPETSYVSESPLYVGSDPVYRDVPDPDVNIFSSASVQYDSFDDLQRQRKNSFLNILGPTSGYDRTTAEAFISAGREALSTDKASTEPGLMDRVSVVDMITQIRAVLEAPPLTLLINPSEFAINYEKLQQYTQRTREGYIFQSWGEGQPVITFSGFTGAFIAGSLGTETSSGVQFASKRNSASYQNLMNLLTIYRNNGHIFDNFSGSAAPHFVGMVAIEYDQWTYIGNFNSFSWGYDEVENQNGRISFDIEFAVSQMFDSHEPSENITPLLKKPRRTVRYPTDPIPEGGGTSTRPASVPPLADPEAPTPTAFQNTEVPSPALPIQLPSPIPSASPDPQASLLRGLPSKVAVYSF